MRLVYGAPAECPSAEAFRTLVESRVPRGWEAAPGEMARPIEVAVSGADGRYVATIEFIDESGNHVARAMRGRICSDLVDGMALITALAIQSRFGEALDESEPLDVPATGGPPALPSEPNARRTTANVAPAPKGEVDREHSRLRVRVLARGAVKSGIGPSVAPGAEFGVVLERRQTRLGMTLQGFSSGQVESRGVLARFVHVAARVEGCPHAFTLSDWASFEPFGFAEFGTLRGEAFVDPPTVVAGERNSALWLSAGIAGRAVGRFGAFTAELDVAAGFPLRREEFYIEGGDIVYSVPALYGSAALGLGARF